jgi:hypothetical protein
VKYGHGDLAFFMLPCESLAIANITTWTIGSCDSQTREGLFISKDTETAQIQLNATEINLKDGFLNHCVTTKNAYCGSALLNSQGQLIGIHMGTSGPSVKGFNNKCIPLKVQG